MGRGKSRVGGAAGLRRGTLASTACGAKSRSAPPRFSPETMQHLVRPAVLFREAEHHAELVSCGKPASSSSRRWLEARERLSPAGRCALARFTKLG